MKIAAPRSSMAEAARWTTRAIDKNPHVPVMAGIVIDAGDDSLTISASNFDVSLSARLPALPREAGKIIVPGHALAAYLENARGEAAEISDASGKIVCQVGRSRATFARLDPAAYPTLPNACDQVAIMDASELRTVVSAVVGHSDLGSPEAWSFGVLLEASGGVLSARGGTRYAMAESALKADGAWDAVVMAGHLRSALEAMDGRVTIALSSGMISLDDDHHRAEIRRLDVAFPAFAPLFAKKRDHVVKFDRDDLVQAAKLAGTSSDRVKLITEAGTLEVETYEPEKGQLQSTIMDYITCDATADHEVIVRLDFLLTTLAALKEGPVEMHWSSTAKKVPVLVTDGDSRHMIARVTPVGERS